MCRIPILSNFGGGAILSRDGAKDTSLEPNLVKKTSFMAKIGKKNSTQ